jgi:streptomycin 6-kinase
MTAAEPAERLAERARAWGVTVDEMRETETSLVAFGGRGGVAVVLKVLRRECDEWRAGEVLAAFGGRGVVRVYEHVPGAMLLECLTPGTPLVELALAGRDDEATDILADVIRRMSPSASPAAGFATVEAWGRGFARYLATDDSQIDRALVEAGERVFLDLCATQRQTRLLHGDLQHYNVLRDAHRGWLAIDPKGVVGELEYEIGAALRNPVERPELFAAAAAAQRRVKRYEAALGVDGGRVLAWGFAQAVLSAIWCVEDGFPVTPNNSALRLARAIRPLL